MKLPDIPISYRVGITPVINIVSGWFVVLSLLSLWYHRFTPAVVFIIVALLVFEVGNYIGHNGKSK